MTIRQIFGMHLANKDDRREHDLLAVLGDHGPVTMLHQQVDAWYARLRNGSPQRLIHVRLYREWWEDTDPRDLARWAVSEFPRLWADPYCLISPANEQNIELRGRMIHQVTGPARRDLYGAIGRWNLEFWREVDRQVPNRRALALWSALAEGHDMEPGVPDSEYSHPTIRQALDYVDVLATHPYADLRANAESGATGEARWWHMLRPWRPAGEGGPRDPGGLLTQVPDKPHFVSETGTFTHGDPNDVTRVRAELVALGSHAARDGRTLALTPFIWSSGPEHAHNVIAANNALVVALKSYPGFQYSATVPRAKVKALPPISPGGDDMAEAVYIVASGDTLSRIGARFGIPWRELAAANGIAAPWTIRVGQHLKLPGVARCSPGGKDAAIPSGRAFEWVEGRSDDTLHVWSSRYPVRFLIMHDPVAGSVAGLLSYLRKNDRGVSYNEVVTPGNPPQVHVLVDGADKRVGHAGFGTAVDIATGTAYSRAGTNLNDVSWGICIYKHKDDNGPFSPDLYHAAVAVAAARARQFGVPTANILSHAEVDPGRRSDPRGVDMVRFRADVAALLA